MMLVCGSVDICVGAGFIKKAIKYYAEQFGSDDDGEVPPPTPRRDDGVS